MKPSVALAHKRAAIRELAASDACQFVDQKSKSDFLTDKRTQQAVIIG